MLNNGLYFVMFQGEFCPEIVSRHQEVLESRYGGRFTAHRAATIIQRAYRCYQLNQQFSAALSLARSEDTTSRRRSIFAEDLEVSMAVNVDSGDVVTSAAARHINNRRRVGLGRTASLRDHRRSGSWSGFEPIERPEEVPKPSPCHCGKQENIKTSSIIVNKPEHRGEDRSDSVRPQTAADLQNKMNQARDERLLVLPPSPTSSPVPPCPPLRGEGFYEPAYLSRDSLYCSVRRPRRLPPRPPQRTVSFLAEPAAYNQANLRPQSVSDSTLPQGSNLPQDDQTYDSCSSLRSITEQPIPTHLRSMSSPDPSIYVQPSSLQPPMRNMVSKRSPLPPPPYIPPPGVRDEPLPPPPSDLVLDRKPCDSVSSIDSGFRSSCSESTSSAEMESTTPTSPHLPPLHLPTFSEIPEDPYSYWVSSPAFMSSPETSNFYRNPARAPCGPNCCCDKPRPSVTNAPIYNTYQDIYGNIDNTRVAQPNHYNDSLRSSDSVKSKKTVRIQLPSSPSQEQEEDTETVRRRNYRVGLNLFNSSPDSGITYLARKEFIDLTPPAVAKFLIGRKGLSKRVVGEYICNLQKPFNLAVLQCMIYDMDFSGLHLDIALRQLLAEVHIPGEAQKIEKLVEVFSRRYIECNQMFVSGFKAPDTIFILAYAMVLLNTDLHNKSIKPEKRMRQEDFLRNLRGIDAGRNVDEDMLKGIYDRIKVVEFKEGPDHVSQVTKVQETITGAKRPNLNSSWRRLVCFCRVAEVADINKKDKKDAHQRGIFLFNDLLVVTKSEKSRSKKQVHQFRHSVPLAGLRVNMYRTTHHQFGVQLQARAGAKVAATFSCRSYNDQQRFVSDLQESIAEVEEMERARLFL